MTSKSLLAERVGRIEPSGIRRMFDLMSTMEDPINLSIGQAHFPTPPELVEAACRAMRDGHNGYTVTQGLAELNQRVLDMVARRHGRRPPASQITAGVSGGILTAFLALLDPGDEILLPDPNFMMYRHIARLCGATVRFYDLYPDWRLDPGQLDELVGERTKVVFLNSPSNPTGGVLRRDEVRALVEAAERVGAIVVSDEIYDAFVYDEEFVSPVTFSDRVVQLGGFSKTYAIAGWRLGFATGPVEILEAMRVLQQFTFVCAPAPFQHAVLNAAFDLDMTPYVREYRAKRDRLARDLDPAYGLTPPAGSFYAFPRLPHGVSGEAFVEAALARKLLVVPGRAFSRRDTHFRLSFAADDATLDRGIAALNELAAELA